MKTAAEYRKQNSKLIVEYEQRVRDWLKKDDPHKISDKIPFFRDGVTNPEVWFAEGNNFRPLFILKEVSTGKDTIKKFPEFLKTWGGITCFEFVENPFDDIKVGTFKQWRRVARLAKGLEYVYNYNTIPKYESFNLEYKSGGQEYIGNIPGYNDEQYKVTTSNEEYLDIINKIAVLEIKKIGGGTTAYSSLSKITKPYTEHIEPFKDLLIKQIELIDPTVIICLGRENNACISELLTDIKFATKERLWIDGYHHGRSSNCDFYYDPLKKYLETLQK